MTVGDAHINCHYFNTPLTARLFIRVIFPRYFFLNLAAWPGVRYVYVRSRLSWFHRREEQDFLDIYRTM
jgi:hypothetical protein